MFSSSFGSLTFSKNWNRVLLVRDGSIIIRKMIPIRISDCRKVLYSSYSKLIRLYGPRCTIQFSLINYVNILYMLRCTFSRFWGKYHSLYTVQFNDKYNCTVYSKCYLPKMYKGGRRVLTLYLPPVIISPGHRILTILHITCGGGRRMSIS